MNFCILFFGLGMLVGVFVERYARSLRKPSGPNVPCPPDLEKRAAKRRTINEHG